MHKSLSALLVLASIGCATAEKEPAPDSVAAPATTASATVPAQSRMDDPTMNAADLKVAPIADGFQVTTTGPAAILYNDADTVSGNYSVQATFAEAKANAAHPEAYGIFAAGADVAGPKVSYLYFITRADGKWSLKHRADEKTTHTIKDWTAAPAVALPDSSGRVSNTLMMTFAADSVRMSVNGTQVHSVPRATLESGVGSSRVDLQACKLEYSIVSPK